MKGINKAIIIGHLGQDPVIRYTAAGAAIANLSVATSENWKDKQTGEKQERTEWHRVVLFGKVAEVAGEFLSKGSMVYIEGKIQTRKWEDKEKVTRYSTEIVVQGYDGQMQMLGGGSDAPARSQAKPEPKGGHGNGGFREQGADWDPQDDIPF